MQTIRVDCKDCGAGNRVPVAKQHRGPKCGKCGTSLDVTLAALPVELEDADFSTFINGATLPVLVDFYSPTCGPCYAMAPAIDNLAKKYCGRALICKLDTSRNQMTASQYQIRGVPSLLFFKNGQVVDQIVGAVPPEALEQKLAPLL